MNEALILTIDFLRGRGAGGGVEGGRLHYVDIILGRVFT